MRTRTSNELAIDPQQLQEWLEAQPEVVGFVRQHPRAWNIFLAAADYYNKDESPIARFLRQLTGLESIKCQYGKVETGFPVRTIPVSPWILQWDAQLMKGKNAGQPILKSEAMATLLAVAPALAQTVPQAPLSSEPVSHQ